MTGRAHILDKIKQRYKIKSNVELAAFLGVTPQTISNWYSRDTIDYDKVFQRCVDTDLNWLLSGMRGGGRKIRSSNSYPELDESADGILSDVTASYETPAHKTVKPGVEALPLYVLNDSARLSEPLASPGRYNAAGLIALPGMPPCDGALYVQDETWKPLLNNGDLLLYKTIDEEEDILREELYLLALESDDTERTVVGRLRKGNSDTHILLIGPGKERQPEKILHTAIRAMARIVAFVRYGSAE